MRPGILLASVVSLGGLGLAIMAGGQAVSSNQTLLATPNEDEATFGSFDQNEPSAKPGEPVTGATTGGSVVAPPARHKSSAEVRQDAVHAGDPPASAAHAAKPLETDEAEGGGGASRYKTKILYRPIAPDTGTIDAMGYTLVIAGVTPLKPDAKCDFEGKTWPCGARARTEFRAWLRDRAVTCEVPEEPTSRAVATRCHIGSDDAGKWLVQNGWASAQPAGPYVKLGEQAKADKRGIFGPPPSRTLPETLVTPEASNLPEPLPEPEITATPPTDLSGPSQ